MSNIATMAAADTISGSEAECYMTVDGRRYNAMNAVSVEATFEKTKKEVPILGKRAKGHKTVGGKGTGKMTMHYASSLFRRKCIEYIHTGKDFYFDMQVANEDPTSSIGRQTVILKDCNLDKVVVAKFAAGDDILDEDSDFTFEDVEMPEEFADLAGM